jgi:hypothetical protein
LTFDLEGDLCKARLDKLIDGSDKWPKTVVDLKKVQRGGATDAAIETACRTYRYDVQAAWYVDAVEKLTGEKPVFVWVFVEEKFPYDVNVRQADAATLALGRAEYRHCLAIKRRCEATGHWPGAMRTLDVQAGGCPEWFVKRRLQEIDDERWQYSD